MIADQRRARALRLPMGPRTYVLLGLAIGLGAALIVGAWLAGSRYLPAFDEARALRADLDAMVDQVRKTGLAIDRSTVDGLDADLVAARQRFERIESLLASDPLVAVARLLPPTAADVRGADNVVAAAGHVLDAVGEGLVVGRRFVDIKEAQMGTGDTSALAELVELLATSHDRAVAASASVARARALLAEVPDGLMGQVVSVRDAMSERIDTYRPFIDTFVEASAKVPAILGWDGPRRYLVLTQNPAELRPTGGFIGSYGIVAFDRGKVTERTFRNLDPLDFPWDYPRINPPQELADYLLGPEQPWQFADANWSPDFPTSARDALRLYTNESGDARIDGVLGITTYTIDELLRVTGPITVPEYDVTIASGETTLKVLQLTRAPSASGQDRKAFLSAFADRLFDALLTLPPRRWGDVVGAADSFSQRHLLLAWFQRAADEAFVTDMGFGGAVRLDPGDYVYPVDSNVAPASKLNEWTTRSLDLTVQLDPVGNARDTLAVTWDNRVNTPAGAAYRAMTPSVGGRILGMYFRVLVPERSRVEEVSGGALAPVTDPAVVEDEAGRMAIGAYLKIPPGRTSLRYRWTSPYAASADATGGTYRLVIQAQPGMAPGPLSISIRVPDGYRITAASPELTVSGGVATMALTFDRDIVIGVEYAP